MSGIQQTGAVAATGLSMIWITDNATALSMIATFLTFFVFAIGTFWNAYANTKRNKINHRILVEDIKAKMIENGATSEEVAQFTKLLRK